MLCAAVAVAAAALACTVAGAHFSARLVNVLMLVYHVGGAQNIVVIGLTQAGERMSDPYGQDEVDLPARQYVATTIKASRKLLGATPQDEAPSQESEAAIQDGRATADLAESDDEEGGTDGAGISRPSPKPSRTRRKLQP